MMSRSVAARNIAPLLSVLSTIVQQMNDQRLDKDARFRQAAKAQVLALDRNRTERPAVVFHAVKGPAPWKGLGMFLLSLCFARQDLVLACFACSLALPAYAVLGGSKPG